MADLPAPIAALIKKLADDAAEAREKAEKAEKRADEERDARVAKEFVAKAAGFDGFTVNAEEFGPVLRSAAENMPAEDFAKLEAVLRSASDIAKASNLLTEVGKAFGSAEEENAYEALTKAADELVVKGDAATREAAIDLMTQRRDPLVAAYRKESGR